MNSLILLILILSYLTSLILLYVFVDLSQTILALMICTIVLSTVVVSALYIKWVGDWVPSKPHLITFHWVATMLFNITFACILAQKTNFSEWINNLLYTEQFCFYVWYLTFWFLSSYLYYSIIIYTKKKEKEVAVCEKSFVNIPNYVEIIAEACDTEGNQYLVNYSETEKYVNGLEIKTTF